MSYYENLFKNYSVRINKRSKNIKIKVKPLYGLEIILPLGADPALAPSIIKNRRDWIISAAKKMEAKGYSIGPDKKSLPQSLELKSLHRSYQPNYKISEHKNEYREEGDTLFIICKEKDRSPKIEILSSFVRDKACSYLPERLHEISRSTGLNYSGVTIRNQKTRWGSCSSRKNINLNMKLMFMPSHLVDQVILHELCHTKIMNHSPSFWELVSQYEPAWKNNEAELRKGWKFIPAWLAEA